MGGAANESNDSPDLFSQDEMDHSLIEVLENTEKMDKTTEVVTSKAKSESDSNKSETPCRQSLFDTIQKMENNPNSSVSSPLLGNQTKNVKINDSNLSMQSEEKSDPSSELKKKISRKITDYFSKKSI